MDEASRATESLVAWRVKIAKGSAGQWLERFAGQKEGDMAVLVLRSDMVFGLDHLRSALYHAKAAFTCGRNASSTLSMETLLYASGERQLQSAIRKMSVDNSTDEIVIAFLGKHPLSPGNDWIPVAPMDADVSNERLRTFGIRDSEVESVGTHPASELVLEKVASVDIIKK